MMLLPKPHSPTAIHFPLYLSINPSNYLKYSSNVTLSYSKGSLFSLIKIQIN